MRSDLPHLAFDTSGPHVAVHLCGALVQDRLIAQERGQAETLPGLCAEVLSAQGLGWTDLRSVSVGIGPGNFTGVRIAVAFARGLALGLAIPAVGVSGFEAAYPPAPLAGPVLLSLPAPRGQAYVQAFADGRPVGAPRLLTPGEAPEALRAPNLRVLGHRAEDIAQGLGAQVPDLPQPRPDDGTRAAAIARVALDKLRRAGGAWSERPAPLYVRAPDASPPREAPPALIG